MENQIENASRRNSRWKRRTLAMVSAGAVLAGLLTAYNSGTPAPAASAATTSYFLKLDGIPGESTSDDHRDEIGVTSYAWSDETPGIEQQGRPNRGGGAGVGRVNTNTLHIVAPLSVAGPKLMVTSAGGRHIPTAVLTARKAGEGQRDFFSITLTDVLVTSYRTTGDGVNGTVDEFDLSFSKIVESYKPQDDKGSLGSAVVGTFNVATNAAN